MDVAIGCTCDELLLIVKDDATGERVERRMPPPPGHNCEYVRRRNELIPSAWYATMGPGSDDAHARRFFDKMDSMVAELYKSGGI
jgi:hypothetical protein